MAQKHNDPYYIWRIQTKNEQEKQTVAELTMKPKEEIEWILKAQRKHPNELNIIKVKNIE